MHARVLKIMIFKHKFLKDFNRDAEGWYLFYVTLVHMQNTSDVEFVVGGKSIHAHKTILVLRCEHFKTMFSGDWKESPAKLVPVIMHACNTV